jgi:hypothetical protein
MSLENKNEINLLVHYMTCSKDSEWTLVKKWLIEKLEEVTSKIDFCVESESCEEIEKHYGDLYMFKKIFNHLVTKPEYD